MILGNNLIDINSLVLQWLMLITLSQSPMVGWHSRQDVACNRLGRACLYLSLSPGVLFTMGFNHAGQEEQGVSPQ